VGLPERVACAVVPEIDFWGSALRKYYLFAWSFADLYARSFWIRSQSNCHILRRATQPDDRGVFDLIDGR
jgi:hypothetical protein